MILFLLTLFHNPASDITSPLKRESLELGSQGFIELHSVPPPPPFPSPPQKGCCGDAYPGPGRQTVIIIAPCLHPLAPDGCEQVRADKDVFEAGQHKCFQEANSGSSIEICIGNIASPG